MTNSGRRTVHLVCNAHIDPVWLWRWEEGAGEALSTFRTAAAFCEEFRGFVFCHNEALLYRFIEEHEPALFRRIRALVRAGRWHVMGGWHVQPDCNLPSGESFVRQALLGKTYFRRALGVDVRTGVNLDPFGHSRGLVQVLAKSGSDRYLFCRPGPADLPLAGDDFVWVGFDGSEVLVHRASAHYNSFEGRERARLEEWMDRHPGAEPVLHLWGIGDHGGGPSRRDLTDIEALRRDRPEWDLRHSTPDAYFDEVEKRRDSLPRVASSLRPWAVGCYTSMALVKRAHRRLENELYATEKMSTAAWAQGLVPDPSADLKEAAEDLAFAEFHDLLPGSAIEAGEADALRLVDHGLEIVSRARARAFFAMAAGSHRARDGEIPVFAYNPHPFPVEAVLECEFEPHEPNFDLAIRWTPVVSAGPKRLPSQDEKEDSGLGVEWRKKVVFAATLRPSQMNRFDVRLEAAPAAPRAVRAADDGPLTFATGDMELTIDGATGLIDRLSAGGVPVLSAGAFRPLVVRDDADPWGMKVRSFRNVEGSFRPASPEEAAAFCASGPRTLAPVRVVEEGEVRTVIEAVMAYGDSRLLARYKVPRRGGPLEVEVRVFWAGKDRMLKLALPCPLLAPRFVGQAPFGVDDLPSNGDEAVSQKWVALDSEEAGTAFAVINDGTYGSDFAGGELRLSLLRSPGYAAETTAEGALMTPPGRFLPRQDQGERTFRFWLTAGPRGALLEGIERAALALNERPFVLPYFPPGAGKAAAPGPVLDDRAVVMTAFKRAESGRDLVVRLYNPTARNRSTTLSLPFAGAETRVDLGPFAVETLRFRRTSRAFAPVDLLERPARRRP